MSQTHTQPASLRWNIVISAFSNIYGVLINLGMTPVYISWMGMEAYGLIGFHAMLQGWFALLDLGLSHAFGRQVSRFHGGAVNAVELRQLLRSLELIFIAVAVIGALGIALGADAIASRWLRAEHLSHDQLAHSIMLMAAIIGARWIAGLYRAMIAASERLVWLGWVGMAMATFRAIGVIGLFALWNSHPTTFFAWQLTGTVIELALLTWMARRLLPHQGQPAPWSWRPLREVLGISLSFAFLIGVWAVVNNLDKLLLSTLLSLHDYAAFTAAVVAASGVSLISTPMGTAVQPRLTRLEAQQDAEGFVRLYRQTTQMLSTIALTIAVVLAFHAEGVLWAWTGDRDLASHAAPVLALYALGNAAVAVVIVAYFLQYAKGELRLHLIGNITLIILLIPAITMATHWWGAVGAGWAWLACNVAYLVFWVPLIHRRFLPGLHLRWLGADVLPMGLATATVAGLAKLLLPPGDTRWSEGCQIAMVTVATLCAGVASSPVLRLQLRQWLRRPRSTDQSR